MVSMDLLPFEICFVGLSVTEKQQFNKGFMTGNSILQRMVCYLKCILFVLFEEYLSFVTIKDTCCLEEGCVMLMNVRLYPK